MSRSFVVLKYGGTSVADASCWAAVAARVRALLPEHRVLVVASAASGVTNLLERAIDELGLDPRRGVMVGDKDCDVRAGQAAGLRSVLVRTGYGAREEKTITSVPDFVADDLLDVVRWMETTDAATPALQGTQAS